MLNAVREVVYNPSRVKYPMVRLDWLKHGWKSDTTQRGDNRFVRVPWSQALDFFHHELERVQTTYGPSALYAGNTGWQSVGKFNAAGTMMQRGVGLHGTFLAKMGDYSTGSAQVVLPYVAGAMEVYEQQTSWPVVLENAKNIVIWGNDPIKNLQVGWQIPDHSVYSYYQQLAEKVKAGEINVIHVDPVKTSSYKYFGGKQIAVNPQTDVPLMLALAYTLYTEKLHDEQFLADYTTGFDKFLPYLLGEKDGVAKTPEWAEKICGVKAMTSVNWRAPCKWPHPNHGWLVSTAYAARRTVRMDDRCSGSNAGSNRSARRWFRLRLALQRRWLYHLCWPADVWFQLCNWR